MEKILNAKSVAVILFGTAAGYYVYSKVAFAWEQRGKKLPPVYRNGLYLPVAGAAFQFLSDPLALARRAEKELGDVFTIKVFGQRLTFMSGPDAQENFFRARDDQLSQQEAYRFSVPLFGRNVVYDADLSKRTEQIKLITNSLHTTSLGQYVPMMVDEAKMYFDKWGDSGEVDLYSALSELIILTASRCLMGKEIRGELFNDMHELYSTLDKGLTPISFFYPEFPIPAHWKRNKAREQMVKLFEGIIERRRARNAKENDVLQVFMDAKYKNGKPLPVQEVTGLMIALLFAGQHTSSVTSTWTGLYILHNKARLMPRLLDEVRKTTMTMEGIKGMTFLGANISEALRLQPPLIFVMREVMEDREYNGMTIPKGDKVFCSPAMSGRREDVFANVDAFDPDRFLPPREEQREGTHTWLSFGGGRHRCIGENFAYTQIKTIWWYLLSNFDMELVGDLPKPNYEALVVGPTPPCMVRYTRRAKPVA